MKNPFGSALCLFLCLSLAGTVGATVWESSDYLLPQLDQGTQLSSTGRAACHDGANRICVLLRGLQEDGTHRLALIRESEPRSWGAPVGVTTGGNVRSQSVAADSKGNLHAVWQDDGPLPSQVQYRFLNETGPWGAVEVLSNPAMPCQEPVLCVDSRDRVHCVWIEENPLASILMHSWRNSGGSWSTPEALDMGRTEAHEPTLAPGLNGEVQLIFVGEPPSRVGLHLFHVVIDAEGDMGAPTQLTKTESRPQLADPFLESDDEGVLYLVWMDNRFRSSSASYDIYLRRYLPQVGWGHEKQVTYEGTTHGNPAIFHGPDHSWNIVIESFLTGNSRVAYRQITRAFGWDPEISRLTGPVGASEDPQIVVRADGDLLLLWSEADDSGVKQVHALEGVQLR